MPKPTQAEVAALVGRLRTHWHESMDQIEEPCAVCQRAADALEALAGEGAEPTWDGNPDTAAEQAAEAGCAKPAGELPPLPNPARLYYTVEGCNPDADLRKYSADQMRAYALRALRERA